MGNFRSGQRNGSGGRRNNFNDRDGGRRSFGGRNKFGGRDRDSRPMQMHDAICAKCKKSCQVPFRPSGDKPVYCSDCFRDKDSTSQRSNGPRNNNRESSPQSSGVSQEQFNKLNAKLDKIIDILSQLEISDEDDEDLELSDDEMDEDIDEENNNEESEDEYDKESKPKADK